MEVEKNKKVTSKKETSKENKTKKTKEINSTKKVKETSIPEEPKKEVIPVITNEIHEDENRLLEAKKEKKSRIIKEIKSFFILLIIIGLIVGATWYWYNYMYDKDRNKQESNPSKEVEENINISYDIKNYKSSNNLALLNDKYIVEYSNKYIYKVFDTNLNIIFEGEQFYNYFYCGSDNNLYVYTDDKADYENIIELFVLKENEFTEVETLNDSVVQYKPILTKDEILLGFIGYFDNTLDEKNQDRTLNNYLYLIGNDNKSVGKMIIDKKNATTNAQAIKINSSKYIIVSLNDEIGVYDIEKNDYLIKPKYQSIISGLNNEYIVSNEDDECYIVDNKDQKVLNTTYDFISYNQNYYVLGKDKIVSIMNDKHEEVANIQMNYKKDGVESLDDGAQDFFYAYNINGNLVLEKKNIILNNKEDNSMSSTIYIFDESGEYEKIETDYFSYDKKTNLIYSYNLSKKELTIYNDDLEVDFDIDLSIYNYNRVPSVSIYNTNSIFVNIGNGLYFERSTGELQGEKQEITYEDGDFKITYNSKEKNLVIKMNDKTEKFTTYSFDISANLIKKEDGTYFIFYDNLAISIVPGDENTNE